VPISIETVPPDAPLDDDAAGLEELADDELDDDELPQAPIASAAMTVSSTEAGLVCLFTDPPPQEVGFPEPTIYSLIASDASRFGVGASRLINPQHSGAQSGPAPVLRCTFYLSKGESPAGPGTRRAWLSARGEGR
jgi:hypothetical protein